MKLFVVVLALVFALSGAYGKAPFDSDLTDSIEGEYIVVLVSNSTTEEREDLVSKTALLGGKILYKYTSVLSGFAASLDEKLLALLLENPLVSFVERNRVMKTNECLTQNKCPWGLSRISHAGDSSPPYGNFIYDPSVGGDGEGVTAYVIDTGIQLSHVEFEGRAVQGFNAFSEDPDEPDTDCNGHGTHVAGTIGGVNVGVAKKIALVAVKVLNCQGSGATSGVIAGIDWVADKCDNKNVCVANLSLGGLKSRSMNQAANTAVDEGVVMVVAAGNENMNAASRSPASAEKAITIGATTLDVNKKDRRSDFSNWGGDVDLFAPGEDIESAWINVEGYTSDAVYNTISGTSMASPHAAGVVAQLIAQDSSHDASDYRNILVGNADNVPIELHCEDAVGGQNCAKSPSLELQSVIC